MPLPVGEASGRPSWFSSAASPPLQKASAMPAQARSQPSKRNLLSTKGLGRRKRQPRGAGCPRAVARCKGSPCILQPVVPVGNQAQGLRPLGLSSAGCFPGLTCVGSMRIRAVCSGRTVFSEDLLYNSRCNTWEGGKSLPSSPRVAERARCSFGWKTTTATSRLGASVLLRAAALQFLRSSSLGCRKAKCLSAGLARSGALSAPAWGHPTGLGLFAPIFLAACERLFGSPCFREPTWLAKDQHEQESVRW
jgi:hypothetical protein